MGRRILAMFMAVVMLIGCVPMFAMADDLESEISQEEAEEYFLDEEPQEEEEEPAQVQQTALDFGRVVLRDDNGSETLYAELTTQQEVENTLLRLENQPETGKTLVLTLHQDWETEHFLTNRENAIEMDLNDFTWKVTGQDVLETEKAVYIHDGTLTFAEPEGYVISVVDGGLELEKVMFRDCALDKDNLICAVKQETDNFESARHGFDGFGYSINQ